MNEKLPGGIFAHDYFGPVDGAESVHESERENFKKESAGISEVSCENVFKLLDGKFRAADPKGIAD